MSGAFAFIGSLERRLIKIVFITLVITLGGCDRSPSNDVLTSDLATYIEKNYAPGLMDIVHVERTDHQIVPDFSRDRRTVSFAADLRLKRDYDFGTWDQNNAATLTLLMAAHAQDIRGVKPSGNKSGDMIHVLGTVAYVKTDGQWHLEANASMPAESETRNHLQERLILLKQRQHVTAMTFRALFAPISSPPAKDLSATFDRAAARLTRQNGGLVVASGPTGHDSWNVVETLTTTGSSTSPIINLATHGARENLLLLRDGVVTATILGADEAALAARGDGPFEHDGTFPDLRALASLFPQAVHVIVMGASPIASVADLYGHRVTIAASGAAAKLQAGDILHAHRVALDALAASLNELPVDEAFAALKRGECDAVILTAPPPSTALHDFAIANAVRLLPMDADAVALLTTGNSNYVVVTVPTQTYPGQARPVTTVGVATLMVSSELVPAKI